MGRVDARGARGVPRGSPSVGHEDDGHDPSAACSERPPAPCLVDWLSRIFVTRRRRVGRAAFIRHGVRDRRPRASCRSIHVPTLDPPCRRRPDLPRRERAGGSPRTSRARATSSCPAATTCRASSRTRSSPRSASSSPGEREAAEPDRVLATVLFTDIVGSTDRRPGWATGAGASSSTSTTPASGGSSAGSGGGRSTRPATASSRRSTVRRGRSAAPRGGRGGPRRLGLERPRRAPHGRARGHRATAGCAAWRCTSARASAGWPGPARSSSRSTVRDLVAGSGLEFEDRGSHALKGVPGEWRVYAVA